MSEPSVLQSLSALIRERKLNPTRERSYVASLLNAGVEKIGSKILEEAREVVEAARESGEEGREHLVKEVADLMFHSLVALGFHNLDWSAVEAELVRRSGISGIEEKESRTPKIDP